MIELVTGDIPAGWLNAALDRPMVGMDTETTGLDREKDKLALIQLYVPTYGTLLIRHLEEWPTRLATLLESHKTTKVFHYASFDLSFLLRDFPFIFPNRIADTKIAAAFFDPKKTYFRTKSGLGSHKLVDLVRHVFGYEMDKSIAVSDWLVDTLSTEQMTYAAKDVIYLPDLLVFIEKKIPRDLIPALFKTYNYLPTKVMLDLKIGRDVFAY